ncbi:MAG: PA0069 family radical SAM protein [Betaproteobacteria bacterium]|nr:PA0069 family radical SAM protein [Betaproteobacteria bacterium]
MTRPASPPPKGRGATLNPQGRFERLGREAVDDGWDRPGEELPPLATTVTEEQPKSVITRNDSPDIPFDRSINPYRGCEHGCVYCYARPSHAWLGLSPGLDFETKLYAKTNVAKLLRQELAKPGYRVEPIALGTNTDPYQPIERERRVTREILEVLAECGHPVTIVTKSALVERDLDLLGPMAERRLARVHLSVTTLDRELARKMEPRAASPERRLQAVRTLAGRGVPVGVMVAPVIPFLTDSELEPILEAARAAGARSAGYVLLRLPHEVGDLFTAWLEAHYPLKARHVMSRVAAMRGGQDNDLQFGTRMRGTGEFADLLSRRFRIACERLGFENDVSPLDTTRFRPPARAGQLSLF